MADDQRYATPTALRAAITDRLRHVAEEYPNRPLPDLLRQFAYDRLLYRIFTSEDRNRWVLKGATALLARLHGQARHSIDVDLHDQAGGLDDAERALRSAAERDGKDHFRFVLAPGRRLVEGRRALRVNVTAYLGATEFARFNVDLVAGTGMTDSPEEAEPLVSAEVPGLPQTTYQIYPLADHVADKLFATVERHSRLDGPAIASTRYRDLVDLVMIARHESVEAEALQAALRAQSERRGLELPDEFRPPDDAGWRAGYAKIVKDLPGLVEANYDAAVETVRRFVEPALHGLAQGRWSLEAQAWIDT